MQNGTNDANNKQKQNIKKSKTNRDLSMVYTRSFCESLSKQKKKFQSISFDKRRK